MTTATMSIKELLAANAASLRPSAGDAAYTKYRGTEFVGTLTDTISGDKYDKPMAVAYDAAAHGWERYHSEYIIHVGYDEPIKWDAERMMWYAPADFD